jgi:hypothetical protein
VDAQGIAGFATRGTIAGKVLAINAGQPKGA